MGSNVHIIEKKRIIYSDCSDKLKKNVKYLNILKNDPLIK